MRPLLCPCRPAGNLPCPFQIIRPVTAGEIGNTLGKDLRPVFRNRAADAGKRQAVVTNGRFRKDSVRIMSGIQKIHKIVPLHTDAGFRTATAVLTKSDLPLPDVDQVCSRAEGGELSAVHHAGAAGSFRNRRRVSFRSRKSFIVLPSLYS